MVTPKYLEWENIGLCGVAGESGSGKTSTMRFFLAQLAMSGTGIILVDGHGRMANATQTLAQSCEPLSKAYLIPVAIDDNTIIEAIELARTIAQNRLDGIDSSRDHVALIIDEIVSIFDRLAEAGKQKQIDRIVSTLEKFATEYRKTEVKAFIAAHNWTQDFVGSAALRRSMSTIILHRVSPEKVGYFTRNAIIRKKAPDLRVGNAFIIQANADYETVYIPKIVQDDLKAIAHLVPETFLKFPEKFQKVSDRVSAAESGVSEISEVSQQQKTLKKWYETFLKLHESGKTKVEIIDLLWNVKPGANNKYRTASKLYDAFKRKYSSA